ncbi:type II secretion system inner membrane protein GspF [Aliamphritea ceti]|uniref:type II secretion system inner membrane protein GspF n=1 Tax=Aliamphritea ceti TaxID=1524258 RepID=UPI0021C451D5|nr:type II secretion system inner membrane protein GspF [Aliamphritea ceti]
MPSFEYHALDMTGKKHRGFIDADSGRQARQLLRDKKLLTNILTPVNEQPSKRKLWFKPKISVQQLALFTQQLAVLIQSGIPIEDALQATIEQSNSKHLCTALQGIKSKVREGQGIAESMTEFPGIFPPVYQALVGAGEKSGDLGKVLLQLADYTERNQQLRNTVLQASIYPIVLTLVATIIIGVLMAYVVPKVVEQFEHVGQQLPLLTRIMISLSDFIVNNGGILICTALALLIAFHYSYRHFRFKMTLHKQLLRFPFISRLLINLETARMLNTLNIMLNSGAPLLQALSVSQQTAANIYFKTLLNNLSESVREGGSLNKAMGQLKLFPPITVFMVANGEISGELSLALKKSAEQQEHQLNNIIAITTRLVEPVLIIIFGLIVLAIVLAILLPIMQLNDLTQL